MSNTFKDREYDTAPNSLSDTEKKLHGAIEEVAERVDQLEKAMETLTGKRVVTAQHENQFIEEADTMKKQNTKNRRTL